MTTRYRCNACGNRTRFDVLSTRRARAFHHYDLGGECTIEEDDELSLVIESVTCRWCGSSSAIEADASGTDVTGSPDGGGAKELAAPEASDAAVGA